MPKRDPVEYDEQNLAGVTVTAFDCPSRPAPCLVQFGSGPAAVRATINDQRLLSILVLAATTSKPVDIKYRVGRSPEPNAPRIDLLVAVSLTVTTVASASRTTRPS